MSNKSLCDLKEISFAILCCYFLLESVHYFNSLPNDKILARTKFKALADDKFIVAKIMIFVFDE